MAVRVTSGDVKAVGAAAGPRNGTGNSFQLIRAALAPVAASCRDHAFLLETKRHGRSWRMRSGLRARSDG